MKHCVILGTRPEIIKLSSIIRHLASTKRDFLVIHTNQHYSREMDEIFFRELELPMPTVNLDVGSGSHAWQTAEIIRKLEPVLMHKAPDIVYVEGDTNTVLAGALTASKIDVPVAHVEAGLRSYDRTMPEEINRVVVDHISRLLFAPTEQAAETLKHEGIPPKWIFLVGNTIVDAVTEGLAILGRRPNADPRRPYFLLTLHRPANVDDEEALRSIWEGLAGIAEQFKTEVVFPVHPRTKSRLKEYSLPIFPGLRMIEPLGFLSMLELEKNASLILTDSGGIQEEACILSKPTVTIRDNTERPETVALGTNMLAGRTAEGIRRATKQMSNKKIKVAHAYGDGRAGQRVIDLAEKQLA